MRQTARKPDVRATGERTATLVSYRNPALLLLGLKDMTDAQHAADTARLTPDDEAQAWDWWREAQAQAQEA